MQILIGESRFDVWFTEHQFGCAPVQAKTFIRIAERRQVLSQNFKATLLGLPDLVEHGTRADGDQRRLPQVACTWLSAIMRAQESLNQAVEKSPLEDWAEPHLVTLADSLRPLAQLYRKVEELCED